MTIYMNYSRLYQVYFQEHKISTTRVILANYGYYTVPLGNAETSGDNSSKLLSSLPSATSAILANNTVGVLYHLRMQRPLVTVPVNFCFTVLPLATKVNTTSAIPANNGLLPHLRMN